MSEVSAGFALSVTLTIAMLLGPDASLLGTDALGTPSRHPAPGYVRVPQHCDSYTTIIALEGAAYQSVS